ncbi:MAG TPA: hypothetical protein PKY29_04435 [Ferruginibacter sp.]|nr:hypothetical protein [Ferruginibacter sp.]HRQ20536.1 hypothetical protein [Ferruginibacter sp.]
MSERVTIAGPVAFLSKSGSAVYFSKDSASAGTFTHSTGTATTIQKLQNNLNIAFWGEDNRFPQNIERQMAYCGIGKSALDWKARALFGGGIIPGKITGIDENNQDIFQPLDLTKYKEVYNFINQRSFFRFMIEYLQDWVWFGNCFPEVILDNGAKKITHLVHQESCDARFQQMDESGKINWVFLSKMWGASEDQYAKFDPKKKIRGITRNPENVDSIEEKWIKKVPCINMYNSIESLREIAETLKNKKGLKSAILPVNYPSVNKTYYQVPAWDGARLGGWIEIACKIPALFKALYNNAYRLRYHIEIPETYFERKFGTEAWQLKTEQEQQSAREELLGKMDEFLTGDENAFKTFVSYFDITPSDKKEYGRVKIEQIKSETSIDKDLVTSSAADIQILIAMQAHPTLFGAGTIGGGAQRSGGSDIREAFLVYNAQLNLERNVLLEPLYLVRDFNQWGDDIVFKIRDTVLTTLDTGAGTTKVLS